MSPNSEPRNLTLLYALNSPKLGLVVVRMHSARSMAATIAHPPGTLLSRVERLGPDSISCLFWDVAFDGLKM